MTKTLQDKIDAISSASLMSLRSPINTWNDVNKAIQELREEIQFRFIWKDCKYCQDAKDILALIGEKK